MLVKIFRRSFPPLIWGLIFVLINEVLTCLQHVHGRNRPILRRHDSIRAQIKLIVLSSFDGEKLFVIHFYIFIFTRTSIWKWLFFYSSALFSTKSKVFFNKIPLKLLKLCCITLQRLLKRLKIPLFNFLDWNISSAKVNKRKDGRRLNLGWKEWKTLVRSENFHSRWNQ